jgi:hypothetical protein
MNDDQMTPAEMLADINEHAQPRLNEWERDFVRDIGKKLDKAWTLSEKQIAKLKAIYEDHVG